MRALIDKHYLLLWGSLAYFAQLVLSLVWYLERISMMDTSLQLFMILRSDALAIQVQRFGAVMTQLFPLLVSRLGCSLSQVAMWYSASFVLVQWLAFMLILLVFKNKRLAWVQLMLSMLMVTYSFFWVQCEFVQGMAFSLVYMAYLERQVMRERTQALFWVLTPLFLVTIAFFYPSLLFLMLYVPMYLALHYRRRWSMLGMVVGLYALILIAKLIWFSNYYDNSAMKGLSSIIEFFPDYDEFVSYSSFWKFLLHDYYMLIPFFGIGLMYLLRYREYKKAGLLVIACLGYLTIVNANYWYGAEQFYLEPQYLFLSVIVALPWAYDIAPVTNNKWFGAVVLLIVTFAFFVRITQKHSQFAKRLQWYETLLEDTQHLADKKLAIHSSQVPKDVLLMTWGSAFENWLISTIRTGTSRSVLISDNESAIQNAIGKRKVFATEWSQWPYDELLPPYFVFNDSSAYVNYPLHE